VAQESSPQPGRPYPPPPASEAFWPAQATILAAIGLQVALPERLTAGPTWLIPALEGALLIGMFLATPKQLEHEHPRRRRVALGLTAFVTAANIYSLGALTHYLLHHGSPNGRELIVAGVTRHSLVSGASDPRYYSTLYWTLALFFVEVWLLTAISGLTVGKRLLGIRVIRTNGGVPGFGWALLRTILLLCVVPPLLADRDLRGLHDRATDTIVVRL